MRDFDGPEEFLESLRDADIVRKRQSLLYASNKYALLVIFQALDAAGKDSAIKHVMSGVNPQGCQVFSFKHPGAEELAHDFLWNAVRRLPEARAIVHDELSVRAGGCPAGSGSAGGDRTRIPQRTHRGP